MMKLYFQFCSLTSSFQMEFSKLKLWSKDQLLKAIELEEVKKYAENEINFWSTHDASTVARNWLSFCRSREKTVRIVECDVPEFVAPANMKLSLSDIKVGRTNSLKMKGGFATNKQRAGKGYARSALLKFPCSCIKGLKVSHV